VCETVVIRVYFFKPPLLLLPLFTAPAQIASSDRFSWLMAQKTCFRVIYVLFAVRTIFLYFPFFSQKNAKFPILAMQKTSMGNNVGSVEDRAVKFACSIGFSAIDTRRLSVCLFVCLFVCPLATSRKTADSSS